MRLTPQLLLNAYCQGIFPMADHRGVIRWYDPDPRAIIPLDTFHVPRRLARTVRNGPFAVRVDTSFRAVMTACAELTHERDETWISSAMIDAYTELHERGFAHCVETWRNGELVGGLYGVSINGLFAGESMFARERDASKVALVHLVERLRRGGFLLLDSQIAAEHTLQFGLIDIPRDAYKRLLAQALEASEATF